MSSPIKGHATRNDIVDDIVDDPSSTMVFNVAKIASARASSTISLTKSLRVAGPLDGSPIHTPHFVVMAIISPKIG